MAVLAIAAPSEDILGKPGLYNAASKLKVDILSISEVMRWDGQEDLSKYDNDSEDVNEMLEEANVPEPPDRVKGIYNSEEATDVLRKLGSNPDDEIVTEGNGKEKMRGIERWNWIIKRSFFYPQYDAAKKMYEIISGPEDSPEREKAMETLNTLKTLIDAEIGRQHYPSAWGIPTPGDYLAAKEAIEAINSCEPDEHAKILGVSERATEEDVINAWKTRGRLINPDRMKPLEDASKAFERLKAAAEAKGVDDYYIGLVEEWTGDANDDGEGERPKPEEVSMPTPPEWVTDIYKAAQAEELIDRLKRDAADPMVRGGLESWNNEIRSRNDAEGRSQDTWIIPSSELVPHYGMSQAYYTKLQEEPNDQEAKNKLNSLKSQLDEVIKRRHLPTEWTIQTAEEFLEEYRQRKEANWVADDAARAMSDLEVRIKKYLHDKEEQNMPQEAASALENQAKAELREAADAAEEVQDAPHAKVRTAAAAVEGFLHDAWELLENARKREAPKLATAASPPAPPSTAPTPAQTAQAPKPAAAASPSTPSTAVKRPWDYPWRTVPTKDSDWEIVGIVPTGGKDKTGKSRNNFVLLESMSRGKNGIPYQKFESASKVGLWLVGGHIKQGNCKDLTRQGPPLTYKDRDDFEELLCVSDGRVQMQNLDSRSRAPWTRCTVRLKGGIRVAQASEVLRVLGETDYKNKVGKKCKELGIPPPWKREPLAVYKKTNPATSDDDDDDGRIKHGIPAVVLPANTGATMPGNDTTSRSPSPAQDDKRMKDVEARMEKLTLTVTAMQGTMEVKMTEMQGKMDEEVTGLKTTMAEATARMNKFEETTTEIKTNIAEIRGLLAALVGSLQVQAGTVPQ
ncbi:uncharacterized protein B0T15DRAFT_554905 [Chaetomium strumarium]|uniref:J domain-containing protein n=1 Tax=Chaetomium strumarium TaxID=1170767 RepID=A0AAJ0GS30_9PEZI|nr:hypothetical protein B0T15DRAFT_554905 [Chaetomium strumarium]